MPQLITPNNMRSSGSSGAGRGGGMTAQVLDVGREPALKSALLSGRLTNLTAPFLYHDPEKQLALVLMPMEMGMADMDQQRIIGQMTQNVMRGLPQDTPKAYLLQPRMFFTFQSLVEAILEADGISKESLQAQQERADLLRDFLRQSSVDAVRDLIRKNDAKVDAQMFDLLAASIDANSAPGREPVMQNLMGLQQLMIEESAFGKVVASRMAVIEAFQKTPTRENMLDQLEVAPDIETRESIIAMGRNLLDYAFFQLLTSRIDAVPDEDAKAKLTGLRKEIQDVRDKVDQASRAAMQDKVALIQEIVSSKDPLQTARDNEVEIDDMFLAVVQANAQESQKRGDKNALEALQAVYNIAMQIMGERQPPEVQLVNALLQAEYPTETEKMLTEIKDQVDTRIIQVMSQLADQLAQNDRTDTAARLTQIMLQAGKILPKYNPPESALDELPVPAESPATAPSEPPPVSGGLVGPDGLIRGSRPPDEPPAGKIEIARR